GIRDFHVTGVQTCALPIFSLHDLPDGRVPPNWCRYMVVDPGHTKMGVLYAAIDPEEKFVTIYDEIRPVQCDAEFLARTVAQRNQIGRASCREMDYVLVSAQ